MIIRTEGKKTGQEELLPVFSGLQRRERFVYVGGEVSLSRGERVLSELNGHFVAVWYLGQLSAQSDVIGSHCDNTRSVGPKIIRHIVSDIASNAAFCCVLHSNG